MTHGLSAAGERTEDFIERMGGWLVRFFHLPGLFVIGATNFWSAATFHIELITAGYASLHDIPLPFI